MWLLTSYLNSQNFGFSILESNNSTYLKRLWFMELFAKGLAQCLAHTQYLMYYYYCLSFLLLYFWPLMGPRKHQKSDLGVSSNDISIIPYTFLSWINFPFSEASRIILRPFHIHRDSSWKMLGKIYLPAPYPTESQRNCSPLSLPSQGHSWETSLELSLQLKAHKPFSPVPSPERGGIWVRRKGPSQCIALVWTPWLWASRSSALDLLEPKGKTQVSSSPLGQVFPVLLGHCESPSEIPWRPVWLYVLHPELKFQWPPSWVENRGK